MVLGLLRNIPILNSLVNKKENPDQKAETETTANIKNEEALIKEGLKPLFIVALPEGDFSELKAKLKEKFSGRDLRFMVDPELKKPKLYIIKESALNKRNSETSLDQDFIKKNYEGIELNAAGERLGESLLRTMNTKLSYLKGAEQKIEYTQKEAEKAKLRESLESLSKSNIHICSAGCITHGSNGKTPNEGTGDQMIRDAIDTSKNNDETTQRARQRREDLKTFLTKFKNIKEDHLKHDEIIQSNNSIYIIHLRTCNREEHLELTFAHRENASNDFSIYKLPFMNFINGDKLPDSSERMTHADIHREMDNNNVVKTDYILSKLRILEQKPNPTESNKIIENDFKSNLNKITDNIKTSLQKITAAAKRSFNPSTTPQSLNSSSILSQGGSFSNVNFTQIDTKQSEEAHLARETVSKSVKELLSNIFAQEYKSFKTSAKEVLSKFTEEETKRLNSPISQYFNEEINQSSSMIKPRGAKNLRNDLKKDEIESYINSRVKISQQIDLLPRLMNKDFSFENNIKGALEQSDQSSIYTNRQLAETKHLQNTTNNSGKQEHDKQVGGIALTGQFSFIDRQQFHEDNKTYKDFPVLPKGWDSESKPATELQTNSETKSNIETVSPVSNTHNETTSSPGVNEENIERENKGNI